VARVALLLLVLLALLAAGCGGTSAYSADKTKQCLEGRGATIAGPLDFVASTATGGAFPAELGDNSVKLVFGQSEDDAEQLLAAYKRFALPNVRKGIDDVLRRYNNVVTLWHEHPQDSDLSLVVGCLK
jgi:hypothetical protein